MQNYNMKNFIIITNDGYTFDNSDIQVENSQILDFIQAESKDKIYNEINIKKYGDFDDISIIELSQENINTKKLSYIADKLQNLIDCGLDDASISSNNKQELIKLKEMFNKIKLN